MVHGVKRPYSLSSNSCHSYISLTLSLQFPPLFLLKVAWENRGFDLSLRNIFSKSLLAHRVLEPMLKVG